MKKLLSIVLVVFLLVFSSGCDSLNRTKVAYTVYPIGYLLKRIGQNKIDPVQIQSDDMVQLSKPIDDFYSILKKSQYFFHIGDLEPYYKLRLSDIDSSKVKNIDLASMNAIYNFKRYSLVKIDNKDTYIEGSYYNDDSFNEIDMPDKDLFLWLDPIGMISMAKDIVETLSGNYIEESDFFGNNYKKLEEELINLDAEYQKLSSKIKKGNQTIKFVSISNSFGTWQKAFGIQVYPVSLSRYGALPNDQQLRIIKQRIKDDGVKYIAYEPNMSKEMVDLFNALQQELNLTRVQLSNLSSLTENQFNNNNDYFSIMYENLTVLENMAVDKVDNIRAEAN